MKGDLSFYKETDRLILRSPKKEDAKILASERSTEFVMRYNLYLPCGEKQIQNELSLNEHFILVHKKNHQIIGCVSVRDDYLRYHTEFHSLSAWLIENMANQGYMTEALEIIIAHLFETRHIEGISLQIFSDNISSLRLAEKLGFEREGYLKKAIRNHRDQIFDLVLFSMDQSNYQTHKKLIR